MLPPQVLDLSNPISDHPDNLGLSLLLLGLPEIPGVGGGSLRWPDLTGKLAAGPRYTTGGTLVNGPTWASTPFGQTCLLFPGGTPAGGAKGEVSLGNIFDGTGSITFAAWMNTSVIGLETNGSTFSALSSQNMPTGSNAPWAMFVQNNGSVFWSITNSADTGVSVTSSFTDNTWARVVGTYDATTNRVEMFKNGVSVGTATLTGTRKSGTGQPVVLGASYSSGALAGWYYGYAGGFYLLGRSVDGSWAARDYVWSKDPSQDPRLRRYTPKVWSFGGYNLQSSCGPAIRSVPQVLDLSNPVSDHPDNAGMLLWCLPLREIPGVGTGKILPDLVGRANPGPRYTTGGALIASPTWTATQHRQWALTFSGSNYVDCGGGTTFDVTTGDFAVGGWLKFTTTSSAFLLCKTTGAGTNGYDILLNSGGTGHVDFRTNGGTADLTSTGPWNDGDWHFIVGTRVTGNIYLYIDGVLRSGPFAFSSSMTNTAAPLQFAGRNGTAFAGFTGTGWFFRNRGVDAAWVSRAYRLGLNPLRDERLRWYTPKLRASAGGFNGTYTSGPAIKTTPQVLDLSNPISDHPDNTGLVLLPLGLPEIPGVGGGSLLLPDLNGRKPGPRYTTGLAFGAGVSWVQTPYGQAGLSYGGTAGSSVAVDLSAYDAVLLAFWFYQSSATTGMISEYTPNYNTARGFICYRDTATIQVGTDLGQFNTDSFPAPSSGAWHRVVILLPLTTNSAVINNKAWVDGAPQTLTMVDHSGTQSGTFANDTLYVGSRGGSSLFLTATLAGYRLHGYRSGDPLPGDGWAARDYRWSQNPRTDPRLRRYVPKLQSMGSTTGIAPTVTPTGTLVIYDMPGTLEYLAIVLRDGTLPTEWSGGISLTVDSVAPVEYLAGVVKAGAQPTEISAGVIGVVTGDTEYLGGVIGAVTGDTEYLGGVTRDVAQSVENLAGVTRDTSPPVENLAGVNMDTVQPVESLSGVIGASTIDTEYLSAVIRDGVLPLEWSGGVQVTLDSSSPLEYLAGAVGSAVVPEEYTAVMTYTTPTIGTENLSTTIATAALPTESLSQVYYGPSLETEWAGAIGLVLDSIAPLEYLAGLAKDAVPGTEHTANLITDIPPAQTENMVKTWADTTMPAEQLGVVGTLIKMATEWLGAAARIARRLGFWSGGRMDGGAGGGLKSGGGM